MENRGISRPGVVLRSGKVLDVKALSQSLQLKVCCFAASGGLQPPPEAGTNSGFSSNVTTPPLEMTNRVLNNCF